MTVSNSGGANLDELVAVAKALGHPGRLRMLAMLRGGQLCVCQLTSVLKSSGSTVSEHLSELRRAGLVLERKRGRWVHYRLTDDHSLRGLVIRLLRLVSDDPQIVEDARVVEAVRAIPVDVLCGAGLNLAAVGVQPAARTGPRRRSRRNPAHVN